MKVSNVKGLANHDGSESCAAWSDPLGEALTGARAGWVLSREKVLVRDADPVGERGRPQPTLRFGEGRGYPARSETPGMHGSNLRENRESLRISSAMPQGRRGCDIPPQPARWGRIEKSKDVRR